ncbi:hypothetical protein, partial [Nocardioides sp.]|uniref:hypothetical protein n=1 Tax=Nocardioides sp. TaxID=35761 RepID=UPI002722B911
AEQAGAQATQAGGAQAGQAARDTVTQVGTSAYVDALNNVLLIGAILCLVCAVLCFFLIRQRDFDAVGRYDAATPPGGPSGEAPGQELGQDSGEAPGDDRPRHVDPDAEEPPIAGGAHAAGAHVGPAAEVTPEEPRTT